jgi:tetratricopeptide (TPR) repeat protein
MKPHAFVAMPFGVKKDGQGTEIDFNRVYTELIKPALEAAGLDVFRADEEERAGDIRTDMFQELLIADLVVADLTLDNPNVWYELGVRHALRAKGVVLVQGPRQSQPFDIYTDRKLPYRLKDGAPDPTTLDADRNALTTMARATLGASNARVVSPVYSLLDHLREPKWRDLLLAKRNEFSTAYEAWKSRMEVARQKNHVGDILVLADETPTQALWIEARRTAGNSLIKLRHFDFALEQFDAALALDADDKSSREKKAVCLGRLGRYEEAREWTRRLTEDYPNDPEVWALAGRVETDNWVQRWRRFDGTPAQMRAAAATEQASLEEAIEPYHKAFIADPSHFYSGINSLTLHLLLQHIGGQPDQTVIDNLIGGVLWASLTAQKRDKKDYWARASYAELCLLVNPKDAVIREYRTAVATANRDWFALDSSRQTLELLRDLEFRSEETTAALAIIDAEIQRVTPPFAPRKVFLFSGHMIDAPGRQPSRFPAEKESVAAQKIAEALDKLDVGPEDLALTQGACGGDLLFTEACQQRRVRIAWLQPFDEPEFIERSVVCRGEAWRDRYFKAKAALTITPGIRTAPAELGLPPKGVDPYERCNLWLLYTALSYGISKVHFVCLWDSSGGDGPGGTANMYEEVKRRTGRVTWIDSRSL